MMESNNTCDGHSMCNLSKEEKIKQIIECLKKDRSLTTLSFFSEKFGCKIDGKKLDELKEVLSLPKISTDPDVQILYFEYLDKIIDGILVIRYNELKRSLLYSDIVAVNDDILNTFKKINNLNFDTIMEQFISKLYSFSGNSMDKEVIKSHINDIYKTYVETGKVTIIDTSYFANILLNFNRNYFFKKEKLNIYNNLNCKLEISEKVINKIISGRKLEKITNIIMKNNYEEFGMTSQEFITFFNESISFDNDRKLKKNDIFLTTEMIDNLKYVFLRDGKLTEELVKQIVQTENNVIVTHIINKFNRFKLKLFDKVEIEDQFIEKIDDIRNELPMNSTNFVIASENRYYKTLANIFLSLNNSLINDIIDNKEFINKGKDLLLFSELFDEYNTDTVISMLANWPKIMEKINYENSFESEIDFMISKINLVIILAKGYASIDEIVLNALGEQIVLKLGEISCLEYLEFYKSMMKRLQGNIPPVEFSYLDMNYKSGDYANPERLLIGKIYELSCIDLANPGEETYRECLVNRMGDTILIRDKNNNLVSRLLLIRRGNVVQIIIKSGQILPLEIFKNISEQILKQSKEKDDNIEYIVVSSAAILNNEGEVNITDQRFVINFPHADVEETVTIVGFKDKDLDINLDFDVEPKACYSKVRKEISFIPKPEEINRLRALRVALEENIFVKEELSRNYESYNPDLYKSVICGEDWYIAIKYDDTIEELVLPNGDHRAIQELSSVKNLIFNNIYCNGEDTNETNRYCKKI